jgi:hypothetical protein
MPNRSGGGQTGTVGAPDAAEAPVTLRALVPLVAAQALVEALVVTGRDELTVAMRAVLVAVIGLKLLFAWGAARLRAGPALGLLLVQGTTVLAALGATDLAGPARLALGGTAVLASVLLLVSLHAFPGPTLPTSTR